jgi:hypothetical protein
VAGESWYPILEGLYETPEAAAFLARILDFDPGPFFKELACPSCPVSGRLTTWCRWTRALQL